MSHQMNRQSMLTRWLWRYRSGGERDPARQPAREEDEGSIGGAPNSHRVELGI